MSGSDFIAVFMTFTSPLAVNEEFLELFIIIIKIIFITKFNPEKEQPE